MFQASSVALPRWAAQLALLVLLPGCSLFSQPQHESAEAMAKGLRDHPLAFQALHAAAAKGPRRDVLQTTELGLGGVQLGDLEEAVRERFGEPTKEHIDGTARWLDYDKDEPRIHLRLRVAGAAPAVVQIQTWLPSTTQTATFMRPLDLASRLAPKYGPPARKLPWERGEVWLYPAANVAYVVTPPDEKGRRVVAGIVVGL